MKKNIKYEDLTEMNGIPLGKLGKEVTHLFKDLDQVRTESALISGQFITPQELVKKEKTVRITIDLNENTLSILKHFAKKHKGQYQKMIRTILDSYVNHNKAILA